MSELAELLRLLLEQVLVLLRILLPKLQLVLEGGDLGLESGHSLRFPLHLLELGSLRTAQLLVLVQLCVAASKLEVFVLELSIKLRFANASSHVTLLESSNFRLQTRYLRFVPPGAGLFFFKLRSCTCFVLRRGRLGGVERRGERLAARLEVSDNGGLFRIVRPELLNFVGLFCQHLPLGVQVTPTHLERCSESLHLLLQHFHLVCSLAQCTCLRLCLDAASLQSVALPAEFLQVESSALQFGVCELVLLFLLAQLALRCRLHPLRIFQHCRELCSFRLLMGKVSGKPLRFSFRFTSRQRQRGDGRTQLLGFIDSDGGSLPLVQHVFAVGLQFRLQ
mmetsp:Transcript_7355/g.16850  ORF Transcript_7355/g.16850 Transcript_7355/m.16850 type:complete len:336 (+) Transcript_7355:438-1445(+)